MSGFGNTRDERVMQRIDIAARTHLGKVRARNEDAFTVDPESRWVVLADGMGGYHGGDVAAQLGVGVVAHTLAQDWRPDMAVEQVTQLLVRAVESANDQIWMAGLMNSEFLGMGSTLVVSVFMNGVVVCAHVGDSRLYRFRSGTLEQLTRDHTVVQEQIEEGILAKENARHAPMKGMLTRGLGVMDVVEPEVGIHSAGDDDLFLWCSDGLTDMLDDVDISERLERIAGVDVIADELIDSANERGGRDNVSVIVARVHR